MEAIDIVSVKVIPPRTNGFFYPCDGLNDGEHVIIDDALYLVRVLPHNPTDACFDCSFQSIHGCSNRYVSCFGAIDNSIRIYIKAEWSWMLLTLPVQDRYWGHSNVLFSWNLVNMSCMVISFLFATPEFEVKTVQSVTSWQKVGAGHHLTYLAVTVITQWFHRNEKGAVGPFVIGTGLLVCQQ